MRISMVILRMIFIMKMRETVVINFIEYVRKF